jgi:hypothetical protein
MKNSEKILIGNLKGKRPLEKPRLKIFKEKYDIIFLDWPLVAESRVKWLAGVGIVMIFQSP